MVQFISVLNNRDKCIQQSININTIFVTKSYEQLINSYFYKNI